MATYKGPPRNSDELRQAILDRYDELSKRLQQIARYVLDEPNAVALETLAVIAERASVQPSAIVRFAKAIGFESASQMQKVIRDGLIAGSAVLGYGERVRQFTDTVDSREAGGPADVASEFIEGNILALNNLRELLDAGDMRRAVKLISEAETVYVMGFRRSLPVSSYLAYSLQQVNKKTVFVDGVGGLTRQQMGSIGEGDLLIAVSYHPYAEETVKAVEAAVSRGADVIAISDSLVNPVAKPASLVLQVREAEIRKFRSLAASICLAQALVISYAFAATQERERGGRPAKGRKRA
jgi:DNA-binding MurR/RpiR family transcriptional regulator